MTRKKSVNGVAHKRSFLRYLCSLFISCSQS